MSAFVTWLKDLRNLFAGQKGERRKELDERWSFGDKSIDSIQDSIQDWSFRFGRSDSELRRVLFELQDDKSQRDRPKYPERSKNNRPRIVRSRLWRVCCRRGWKGLSIAGHLILILHPIPAGTHRETSLPCQKRTTFCDEHFNMPHWHKLYAIKLQHLEILDLCSAVQLSIESIPQKVTQ